MRDQVANYVSGAALAVRADSSRFGEVAELVAGAAATAAAGWWCHVDLDVLDPTALPAVDYPQPGGLTWNQLDQLTATCLSVPGCLGASVVIYNPDLDGGQAADRIATHIAFIRDRLRPNP